jgi:hypothetical protein
MNVIDYFKVFILCSGADVNHIYVKRIHLVVFSYIVKRGFAITHISLYF